MILSGHLVRDDVILLYVPWFVCNNAKLRSKFRNVRNDVKVYRIIGFVRDDVKPNFACRLSTMTLNYSIQLFRLRRR